LFVTCVLVVFVVVQGEQKTAPFYFVLRVVEYNVNFILSLSEVNDAVCRKFGDICGM